MHIQPIFLILFYLLPLCPHWYWNTFSVGTVNNNPTPSNLIIIEIRQTVHNPQDLSFLSLIHLGWSIGIVTMMYLSPTETAKRTRACGIGRGGGCGCRPIYMHTLSLTTGAHLYTSIPDYLISSSAPHEAQHLMPNLHVPNRILPILIRYM